MITVQLASEFCLVNTRTIHSTVCLAYITHPFRTIKSRFPSRSRPFLHEAAFQGLWKIFHAINCMCGRFCLQYGVQINRTHPHTIQDATMLFHQLPCVSSIAYCIPLQRMSPQNNRYCCAAGSCNCEHMIVNEFEQVHGQLRH